MRRKSSARTVAADFTSIATSALARHRLGVAAAYEPLDDIAAIEGGRVSKVGAEVEDGVHEAVISLRGHCAFRSDLSP